MRTCPSCERCYGDESVVCAVDGSNTKLSFAGPPIIAGRYQLDRLLGRVAMGSNYLSHDTRLHGRTCVLNIIRQDAFSAEDSQEISAERFEKGAQAAASIRHPNVLEVLDYGETAGRLFYLVTDYVEGVTLQRTLRRDISLPIRRAVHILIQAAAGMSAAHEKGVLHLDLKPETILLIQTRQKSGGERENELIKVAHFSLLSWANNGKFAYGLIGTPTYTAPEQITPAGMLDARTDVYALGSVAYEMLCGRPPFSGELLEMIGHKLNSEPPSLRSFRPEIPPSLERAVMHALAVQMDARPASMSEWIEELESEMNQQTAKEASHHPGDIGQGPHNVFKSPPQEYDVFISYRREGSSEAARAIRAELCQHQVRVFLDVDELRSGHFDQALLDRIARTPNFIVILAPNCLDRCASEQDWLRQEIVQAIKLNKNIIPVAMPGFAFPAMEQLPADLQTLELHQRVRYDHEYFEAMIGKILRYFRPPE